MSTNPFKCREYYEHHECKKYYEHHGLRLSNNKPKSETSSLVLLYLIGIPNIWETLNTKEFNGELG